jgi:hypothetical protein
MSAAATAQPRRESRRTAPLAEHEEAWEKYLTPHARLTYLFSRAHAAARNAVDKNILLYIYMGTVGEQTSGVKKEYLPLPESKAAEVGPCIPHHARASLDWMEKEGLIKSQRGRCKSYKVCLENWATAEPHARRKCTRKPVQRPDHAAKPAQVEEEELVEGRASMNPPIDIAAKRQSPPADPQTEAKVKEAPPLGAHNWYSSYSGNETTDSKEASRPDDDNEPNASLGENDIQPNTLVVLPSGGPPVPLSVAVRGSAAVPIILVNNTPNVLEVTSAANGRLDIRHHTPPDLVALDETRIGLNLLLARILGPVDDRVLRAVARALGLAPFYLLEERIKTRMRMFTGSDASWGGVVVLAVEVQRAWAQHVAAYRRQGQEQERLDEERRYQYLGQRLSDYKRSGEEPDEETMREVAQLPDHVKEEFRKAGLLPADSGGKTPSEVHKPLSENAKAAVPGFFDAFERKKL